MISAFLTTSHPISERREMSTQSLPAVSLRTGNRLPAARVLLWVSNYLIFLVLSLIKPAISDLESSFLPALRETAENRFGRHPGRDRRPGALSAGCLALDRCLDAVAGQIRRDVGAGKLATPARPLWRVDRPARSRLTLAGPLIHAVLRDTAQSSG